MGDTPDISLIERFQTAALLIEEVLEERLSARFALNRWPAMPGEAEDPSLATAYQALWHFEADEDRHRTEVFYLDAQMALLRQMARILSRGEPLPEHLRQAYAPEARVQYYLEAEVFRKTILNPMLQLRSSLLALRNMCLRAFECAGWARITLFSTRRNPVPKTVGTFAAFVQTLEARKNTPAPFHGGKERVKFGKNR